MRRAVTDIVRDDSLRRTLSAGAAARAAMYDHAAATDGVVNALEGIGVLSRPATVAASL
jgi:hypothetical protein